MDDLLPAPPVLPQLPLTAAQRRRFRQSFDRQRRTAAEACQFMSCSPEPRWTTRSVWSAALSRRFRTATGGAGVVSGERAVLRRPNLASRMQGVLPIRVPGADLVGVRSLERCLDRLWTPAQRLVPYRLAMGGPTVAILLPPDADGLTTNDLLKIARRLDAEASIAHTFHVTSTDAICGATRTDEPRPFGLAPGGAGLHDSGLRATETLLGFRPAAAVEAFAYANRTVDHRILGELALFLAREFRGVVDFGGTLGDVSTPRGELLAIPYDESTTAPLRIGRTSRTRLAKPRTPRS